MARPIMTKIGMLMLWLSAGLFNLNTADAQGDVKAGHDKAQKCEACHGLDGLAKIPESPNLAGQNEHYMVEQLLAFQTGERKNEMMSVIAPTLSSQDIEDLAAYYAAIEVKVGKIPDK
jgi:cytochrome c553